MPRVTTIRVSALRSLAEQLRFAPRETLVRQTERAEQLAAIVDPAGAYPEDWIVHSITGYRPESGEPAIIVGAALLAELSALVERLSDGAALGRDELPGAWLSLAELRARWGVSSRTIERWRRRGLLARRVREPSGRPALAFALAGVEAFERAHPEAGAGVRSRRRLPRARRERLARAARLGARLFGWTLNQAAARLAPRYAVARETARQTIRRFDALAPDPAFAGAGPLTSRERLVIVRALRRGIEPGVVARRFDRTRAGVLRVHNERRADLLRRLRLPAPHERPPQGLGERVLELDAVRVAAPARPESTVAAFAAAARRAPAPSRAVEDARARAHALLMAECARRIAELPRFAPTSEALDRIETGLRWACALRAALARDQLRAVLEAIEARLEGPIENAQPDRAARLHAAAMAACIQSIADFEPDVGRRLAGAAALAIDRALARAALAPSGEADPARARRARPASASLIDWTRTIAPWQRWLDPDPRLVAYLPAAAAPVRAFVERRFALASGPPMTCARAAALAGLSPARALTLERAALRAARADDRAGALPPASR